MKQHITFTQFNSLTLEQKKTVKRWWKPQDGDRYVLIIGKGSRETHVCGKIEMLPDGLSEAWPLFSIGQMIDFLDEHTRDVEHFSIRIGRAASDGFVFPRGTLITQMDGFVNEIEDEPVLCDVLWEAVKEVVEKKV
jgi:hypothetical protein